MSESEYLVELRHITKRYPGTVACDDVSIGFKRGEVHTILGENGAGKSTLMNVMYGLTEPDEGEIFVEGKRVRIHSPKDAIRCGIGMVHQHVMLVPTLTVAENIVLSANERDGIFVRPKEVATKIKDISDRYGLSINPYEKVGNLTVGQQQRVEIIKALYKKCEILVLDEPTAVLTPVETGELFVAIHNLISEKKAVVFISHKMKEVMRISNVVSILHLGKVSGHTKIEDTDAKTLAKLMVGRDFTFESKKEPKSPGEVRLEVKNLHVKNAEGIETVRGLNMTVRAGEIYGIAGVDGNGQSELIRSIMGLCEKKSGTVLIKGQDVSRKSTGEIMQMGLAHIPEDRQGMGVILQMSIRENAVLDTFHDPKLHNGCFMDWIAVENRSRDIIQNYDVKTPNDTNSVASLSGGNQQKLVVGRELNREPEILFAVHPTRGVDIGATKFIHDQLIKARDNGCAVVLVSTELDEVLELSDRVAVIFNGQILGEMPASEATYEKVGLLMAGNKLHDAKSA